MFFLLSNVKLKVDSIFKVNDYISLKLEGNKTNIYVENKLFLQCKYLLLNIQVDEVQSLEEVDSIDEAAEVLNRSKKSLGSKKVEVPPKVEFWGHCSNLQAWYENDYDTRLLHSNLALPLLKKLTEVGDPEAKKVFREEVLQRLEIGSDKVVLFLLENNYLKHFTKDEFKEGILRMLEIGSDKVVLFLLENNYLKHFTQGELLIIYENNLPKFKSKKLLLPYLHAFSSLGLPIARRYYKRKVKDLLSTSDFQEIIRILRQYGRYLLEEDCIYLFDKLKSLKTGDSERGNRLEALDRLMHDLQYDGVNFKIPYKISTLLREEEQEIASNILLNSQHPYVKLDFQADEVRRRVWEGELYYEFFEGYIMDLELLCNNSNEDEFYENLKAIRHLKKLRHLNLIFFCEYDLGFVEHLLSETNFEEIKLYEFSNDVSYPKVWIIRDKLKL